MSEHTPETDAASPVEPVTAPDGSPGTGTPVSGATGDPETFPREYVEQLRRENAEARTKAKRVEALTQQAVSAYVEATGRMADPTDLQFTVEMLDDDGLPDRAKVLAAVDELLARKPHLASTRVAGDVGQGIRGDRAPMVSLGDLLRASAG